MITDSPPLLVRAVHNFKGTNNDEVLNFLILNNNYCEVKMCFPELNQISFLYFILFYLFTFKQIQSQYRLLGRNISLL